MNASVTKKFDSLYKRMMAREESVIVEIIDGCKFVARMNVMDSPLRKKEKLYFWGVEYFRKTEKGYWKKLYRCGLAETFDTGVESLVEYLRDLLFAHHRFNGWIRLGEEEKKTWIRLFEESEDTWNKHVGEIKRMFDPSTWSSEGIYMV